MWIGATQICFAATRTHADTYAHNNTSAHTHAYCHIRLFLPRTEEKPPRPQELAAMRHVLSRLLSPFLHVSLHRCFSKSLSQPCFASFKRSFLCRQYVNSNLILTCISIIMLFIFHSAFMRALMGFLCFTRIPCLILLRYCTTTRRFEYLGIFSRSIFFATIAVLSVLEDYRMPQLSATVHTQRHACAQIHNHTRTHTHTHIHTHTHTHTQARKHMKPNPFPKSYVLNGLGDDAPDMLQYAHTHTHTHTRTHKLENMHLCTRTSTHAMFFDGTGDDASNMLQHARCSRPRGTGEGM
jgi:hypothetical protein